MKTLRRKDLINVIENPKYRDDPNWDLIVLDSAISYFEETFGKRDWCDISQEGTDVLGLILDMDLNDSPADAVLAAVAAQAANGVFCAFADAIGIEKGVLHSAIADWYEREDNHPESVGLAGLQKGIEAIQKAEQCPTLGKK